MLLVIAADQEEDLGLKSKAIPISVEITQEWVFLKDFEQEFGGKGVGQHSSQCSFADTNNAFYSYVFVVPHGLS